MPYLIRGALIGAGIWLSLATVTLAALLVSSWRRRPARYHHVRCPMCEGKGAYFVDDVKHPSAYDECPMCSGECTLIVKVDD